MLNKSRMEGSKGQSGKARLNVLFLLLLSGVLLIVMALLENASGEVIGGIVGGLVVLYFTSLWYKFRTFQLYYLDTKESLTAEHMSEYTAMRTEVGHCRFRIRLRPRIGLQLEKYSFVFFDRGKLPWLVGRRRSTEDARVCRMRYFNHNDRRFHDATLKNFDNEGSYAEKLLSLPGGSCTYFELDAEISNALKSWEGILSFQIYYERDGNPEKKNVRTKFFVRANDKTRTLRSIGKKILRATPIPKELLEVAEDE